MEKDEVYNEEELKRLSKMMSVVSNVTRLKILYALLEGDKCVSQLQEETGCSQSLVSHQLQILKEYKLIRFEKNANKVIYSLIDDHIVQILSMAREHILEEL